jgi:hypothetical protein
MELMRVKQLAEEEGLSDDERKDQIENNQYYAYLKKQRIQNHLKQMDEKEKKMEEEMGDLLVDYNENKRSKETQDSKTTNNTSKNSKNLLQPKPFNMMMAPRFGIHPIGKKKVEAIQIEPSSKENK